MKNAQTAPPAVQALIDYIMSLTPEQVNKALASLDSLKQELANRKEVATV